MPYIYYICNMTNKKNGIEIRSLIKGRLADNIKNEKKIKDCSFSYIVKDALRNRYKK